MTERTTDNTAEIGVNAVQAVFLEMGWIFRRQHESDFGIDAQVEITEDGKPTGKLLGIQIKCGSSFFKKRGESYVYYGTAKHLEYWDSHCLPVLLVLHDPESMMAIWKRVERHLVEVTETGWSIEIPQYKTLRVESEESIIECLERSDPTSERRRRLALDIELMRRVEAESESYVDVEKWVNKSLNFRGAVLRFGEPDDNQDSYRVDFWLSSRSVSSVFEWLFPWLDYRLEEIDDDCVGGEVEVWTYIVELNSMGKAFLALEDFFATGELPEPQDKTPEPPVSDYGDYEG